MPAGATATAIGPLVFIVAGATTGFVFRADLDVWDAEKQRVLASRVRPSGEAMAPQSGQSMSQGGE